MSRLRRVWARVRRFVVRLAREVQEDAAVDAAASVAFWLLLSIPAAALAIIASLSFLDADLVAELETSLLDYIDRTFGEQSGTLEAAVSGLFEQSRPGLLSLSIVFALVTLSRGFAGLIRALDVVYDVEDTRNFVKLRVVSLGLAFGTLLTVAASTYLWSLAGRSDLPSFFTVVGAFLVLVLWAATIFHVGPNHHTPWRYDLPGALVAAGGWFTVSLGFGWYVQLASTGNEIVGAVGALLLGLTWLWVVCLALLIGGEVNEMIADQAGVKRAATGWLRRSRELLRIADDDQPGATDDRVDSTTTP